MEAFHPFFICGMNQAFEWPATKGDSNFFRRTALK